MTAVFKVKQYTATFKAASYQATFTGYTVPVATGFPYTFPYTLS